MTDRAVDWDCAMRELRCHICGNSATCIGRYESMEHDEPACDECCGHGCEDGNCTYLTDEDGEFTPEARDRVHAWATNGATP